MQIMKSSMFVIDILVGGAMLYYNRKNKNKAAAIVATSLFIVNAFAIIA